MHSSPVFQGETCELSAIVDPFELQGPAALRHAGQDQTVPLQVYLGLGRLHLKIRWDIIYWKETDKKRGGNETNIKKGSEVVRERAVGKKKPVIQ